MKPRVDHKLGQYRAELFEEVLVRLLQAMYPDSRVSRDVAIPRRAPTDADLSVDFIVQTHDQLLYLVEARAPYSERAVMGINKALKRLRNITLRFPHKSRSRIKRVIVAVAEELPFSKIQPDPATQSFFKEKNIEVLWWGSSEILELLNEQFGIKVSSTSLEDLEVALLEIRARNSGHSDNHIAEDVPAPVIREGEYNNVVVLYADFCSYSRFVHASIDERDLTISIMGRFYRESRRIVTECGGILDKFMGDGILIFWLNNQDTVTLRRQVEDCAKGLIGMSLAIAREWQEQIDHAVPRIGMTLGGAVGRILFIAEEPSKPEVVHAIGESINIAARLQANADPNNLLIANRLKNRLFDDDEKFTEMEAQTLRNIGDVIAWRKDFTQISGVEKVENPL